MIGLALLLAGTALAGEARFGLFVGNDEGGTGEQRLLFATSDATKMRDQFVRQGRIPEDDAVLLLDRGSRDVSEALRSLRTRIVAATAAGDQTTLVFYYSGHGDDQGLHLGGTSLPHDVLRDLLEGTSADVRVAMLDACQSGAAVRRKGVTRGAAHTFAVGVQRTHGTAYLTSSAASEFSQESEEIGGGFFTHYLHTALAGAADANLDGDVTLSETYAFVNTETAFATRETPEAQSPAFDLDLTGTREVWLSRLTNDSATLTFDGHLAGTYAIWDEGRRRYVAEVDGGRPVTISVAPGTYYAQHRMPAWVDQARYRVAAGQSQAIDADDFSAVAYSETASRGPLLRQARRAKLPDLQLQALIGVRGLSTRSTFAREYIPPHVVGGVAVRWLARTGPYVTADLLSGGGPGDLLIGEVGPVAVIVQSATVGAAAGVATRPATVRAGVGGRAALTWFHRDFPSDLLPAQDLVMPAIGLEAWVGLHRGRGHVDLSLRDMLLPVTLDDHATFPVSGTLLLAGGYRF